MDDSGLDPRYEVEIDLRGETLIYREPARGRQASVICTFGPEPWLLPRTLDGWWHPAEARRSAMTDAERAALIPRLAAHARGPLGLRGLQIE